MPQHYPKNTVEASIWCSKCNKETPWRIADGRRQYCLNCYQKHPIDNISKKAGEMEREAPLFFGTGENPTLF